MVSPGCCPRGVPVPLPRPALGGARRPRCAADPGAIGQPGPGAGGGPELPETPVMVPDKGNQQGKSRGADGVSQGPVRTSPRPLPQCICPKTCARVSQAADTEKPGGPCSVWLKRNGMSFSNTTLSIRFWIAGMGFLRSLWEKLGVIVPGAGRGEQKCHAGCWWLSLHVFTEIHEK